MGKNRGQRKFLCPAFFMRSNGPYIISRRTIRSNACKLCRNVSQLETGFCYPFDASNALRIMEVIMFSCFGVAVCRSSSSASMS